MNQEAPKPAKRGRPQKVESEVTFNGFTQSSIHDEYFRVPTMWINVCAEIDNLAELKVVQYVMRHTWGHQEYDTMKHITLDEFVNGRKYRREDRAGERMDFGTGLSKEAVINGLARAVKHGFLICSIDDSDRARIKKYYALKLAEEEQIEELLTEEDEVIENDPAVIVNYPDAHNNDPAAIKNDSESNYQLPRTKERTLEETLRTRDIRIPSPSSKNQNVSMFPPGGRQSTPTFIQNIIDDFSRGYGDEEHIRSNISQANNIYRASGMDEEQFVEVLYAAIDTAKKASVKKLNSRGYPNRVPYFFKCLSKLAEQSEPIAQ